MYWRDLCLMLNLFSIWLQLVAVQQLAQPNPTHIDIITKLIAKSVWIECLFCIFFLITYDF